jgi:hypothetical protein
MRSRRLFTFGVSLTAVLAIGMLFASLATAAPRTYSTTLTGAAEVPGPGDPDGSGSVTLTFNPGSGQVCYDFETTGVSPLIAAHIHDAPAGSFSGVFIGTPPTSATGGHGCVTAPRKDVAAVLARPHLFYFNVHTADFQPGALRGQLSR